MRSTKRNSINNLAKAISFLLIFAFSFISFVQIVHDHTIVDIEHVDIQKDSASFSEKCVVCDYLLHQHGKDALLPSAFSISFPLPKAITFTTGVFVGNYKFTLQGFTNKGPPALA